MELLNGFVIQGEEDTVYLLKKGYLWAKTSA
jgi:hypothetical protein